MNLYFCEFSCFCSRGVADSVLGFDLEPIGSIFSGVGKVKHALKGISNRLFSDAVSWLEKDGIVHFSRL
jgi:hypothetical protein